MSNQLQTLKQSNPNGIVSAPKGSIFTRSGDKFFLVSNGVRKDLNVTKKSFAAEYKNEIWYPTVTNDSISFATNGETWLKVSDTGKNGWAKTTSKTSVAQKFALPAKGRVINVFAGFETSYFLFNNNELWGAGASYEGQLGFNNVINTSSFLLSDVKKVATNCEAFFAAALKNDGTLWFTGENWDYQFGDGEYSLTFEWTQAYLQGDITGSGAIVDVSAGGYYTSILTEDGKVWMATDYMPNFESSIFMQVAEDVKAIYAGGYNMFYIKNDDSLWGFGWNWDGEIGNGTTNQVSYDSPYHIDDNVKYVAGGAYHTAYIKNDDTLWMMGASHYGQLGVGENPPEHTTSPIQVASNVKNVACGENFTLYVTNDNELYGAGRSEYGELGLGIDSVNAKKVYNFALIDTDVSFAAAGAFFSLYVKKDKFLYGMGENWAFQAIGRPIAPYEIYYTPETGWTRDGIIGLDNYINFYNGTTYLNGLFFAYGVNYENWPPVVALYYSNDGKIWNECSIQGPEITKIAYGNGVYVASGDGGFPNLRYSTDGITWNPCTSSYSSANLYSVAYGNGKFVAVGNLNGALISTDGINWTLSDSTHAIMHNIRDIAYGNGVFSTAVSGRFGIRNLYSYTQSFGGDTVDRVTEAGLIKNNQFYSCGMASPYFPDYDRFYFETSSLVSNGDIVDVSIASYYNKKFYLKLKTNGNLEAVDLATLQVNQLDTNVSRSFFASPFMSGPSALYIKNDNTLWGFGTNVGGIFGQGGNYTTQSYHIDDDVIEASFGWAYFENTVYYIKSDGTFYGYGSNANGQLGTGDNNFRTSSVVIDTNVKYCEASNGYVLYIKNDNTLWGMGSNYWGNLGLPDNNDRNTPTFITSSVATILKLYGSFSTTIVALDGNVYAAGANGSGELGLGYANDYFYGTYPFAKVPGISNVVSGATGKVITNDGKYYVCGTDYGNLGLGYKTDTNLYSYDGNTWHTSSITNIGCKNIAYGNNKFVMTSYATWEVQNYGFSNSYGRLIFSSTDAINWTSSYIDTSSFVSVYCNVNDGSKFFLLTEKYTYVSTDGITWATQSNWPDISDYRPFLATDGTKYILIQNSPDVIAEDTALFSKQ